MRTMLAINVIILVAYCWELLMDYDVILDKSAPIKKRKKYIIRLAISSLTGGIALYILYTRYGASPDDILNYLRYGR